MSVTDIGGWPVLLQRLIAGEDLNSDEASGAMAAILAGDASPVQIAGFAVALRMKGETVEEIVGLVSAMLLAAERLALPPGIDAVDTCGTGGSSPRRSAAFNVSTVAALVTAGAGAPVCKHGGRVASATSSSGDVLERLGVAIDLGPDGVGRCVVEAGMGFCFAPRFHPAMRHAAPTRKELGVSTVFNLLGPLTNPAGVRRQVLGLSDPAMAESVLGVLRAKGAARALVVHGHDGLDELTISTTSTVHQLEGDQVRSFVVDPAELGIDPHAGPVEGGDAGVNADLVRRVLDGERGPHRDIVLLNAAAALVASGRVETLAEGFAAAASAVDDGDAGRVLERLVAVSQSARQESTAS